MIKKARQEIIFLKRILFLLLASALCVLSGHIISPRAYASEWANPLNITIWVGYPVDATQAALIQNCVNDANLVLWDVTDGQFRLGTVTLTASIALKNSADIWLLPEDGRAGLGMYPDGTSLETASNHITMFQNSLDGDVLAHELCHYVFGIGDEYEEGSGVGNNCAVPGRRIGPCTGPVSAPGNPAYCLMQQNGNASEFCVTANHDPQMGNLAAMDLADYDPAYITSWGDMDLTLPDVGVHYWWMHADDFWCIKAYDAGTLRYEATQQSGLHYRVTTDNSTIPPTHTRVPLSCWETIQLNRPSFTAPAGNPVDAPPPAPPAVNFVNNVSAADKVLLIMDRSGSMGWSVVTPGREVCGNGIDDDGDGTTDEGECDTEKLTYAKAAARGFIDLYSAAGTNQLGLHSFSSWAGENRALAVVQAQNCALPAEAGTATCLLKSAVDSLNAGGTTDIYEALQLAYNTLSPLGGNRAVFMLTDGCHNNPGDPADWVDDYAAAGIQVFTITVGSDVNQELINSITSSTSGEQIAVQSASDLQAAYAEMAAYLKGEGIILPRTAGVVVEKAKATIAGQPASEARNSITYPLQVTSGAQRLVVFISNTEAKVNGLDARLTLSSPSSAAYNETTALPNAKFVRDPFYLFAVIENPQAGIWNVNVMGTGSVQPFQILASEFQPQVSFRGSVKPTVVHPGKPVDMTAVPAFFRDLFGEKVAVTFEVERPDSTVVTGSLIWHEHLDLWHGRFDRFTGPGLYRVRFKAQVEAGAQVVEGESIFGPPSPPVRVPAFVRHYTTAFFVAGDTENDPRPDGEVTVPRGKMGLSFHVGSAHPLGGWNSQHDANIHFHFDVNYALTDNVNLLLLAGINQFTADWSSNLDNRYWHFIALDAQWRFYRSSWLSWYLQGGPGWYKPKTGSSKAGFNVGIGARLSLGVPVALECGLDYHYIADKEKTKFLVTRLGVVFDLALSRKGTARR
jgi:hypothetical protein